LNLAECSRRGDGVTPDADEARRLFLQAAHAGLVQGLLSLAEYLRSGDGFPRDFAKARELLEEALLSEQCVSAFALGGMYESGEGVAASIDKAAKYYQLAREHRHPEAFRALRRIGRAPDD